MCGISGYIPSPDAPPLSRDEAETRLQCALDAIAHRGPDGRGMAIDDTTGVALGHVRLSIIDLSDDGTPPHLLGGSLAVSGTAAGGPQRWRRQARR